jgi:RNA polymerase sigma-70 factor (ECF subfamily)
MSATESDYGARLEPYRRELQVHCYRMLGSVHDAEDAVQDTLTRAWRGLDRFEGRSSLRSWLYTIATNVCLRMTERRPARVLAMDYCPPTDPRVRLGTPVLESISVQPYPDAELGVGEELARPEARYAQREAVELAFIAALQQLPARQRAVLILRDVLGFTGGEVAEAMGTTRSSVYSLLQRAHARIDERLPERTQQATLRLLGDEDLREIVDRYVNAWTSNDVDALVELLTDDVALAMPPTAAWYRGRDAVIEGLRTWPLSGDWSWRLLPAGANGQPAVGAYRLEESGRFEFHHLMVITLRGRMIDELNAFHDSDPARFGLPLAA